MRHPGSTPSEDFRGLLARLERAGVLRRIKREVDPRHFSTLLEQARGPLLFERVKGYDSPAVGNVAGNRRCITEGLRVESDPSVRVTTVSPGVVESELADHIADPEAASFMVEYRAAAISPDAVARAVSYALAQPADVDVTEIIVRPAAQR